MNRELPKQPLAAREAHEALLELKRVVDEATKTLHAAELESFHVAALHAEAHSVRRTLRHVRDRLKSADFEMVVSQVVEKLEVAISA